MRIGDPICMNDNICKCTFCTRKDKETQELWYYWHPETNFTCFLDALQCDGETLDLGGGPTLEGIALLNIGSIYGGSNLWGTSRKTSSSWHLPILFPHISDNSIQLQHRVQVYDSFFKYFAIANIKEQAHRSHGSCEWK